MFRERLKPPRRTHHFHCAQEVELPLEEVFAFHGEAANLNLVTPPWLRFEILPPVPTEISVGTRIDYRIRWHGIPLRWQTEILVWEPPHRFVDVQRRGPFRWWHHEHRFERRGTGTLVIEDVDYAGPPIPFVHALAVRPDVEKIFAHRRKRLAELLRSPPSASALPV